MTNATQRQHLLKALSEVLADIVVDDRVHAGVGISQAMG
jgi:hypothetical protein